MTGPRIYSTGPGVFSSEPIRDADHAKTILRRYSQYFDTKTLKMYMSGEPPAAAVDHPSRPRAEG